MDLQGMLKESTVSAFLLFVSYEFPTVALLLKWCGMHRTVVKLLYKFWNLGEHQPIYTASHSRTPESFCYLLITSHRLKLLLYYYYYLPS